MTAEVQDNRLVRLRPDVEDPLSRGAICPKGMALGELHEDPDRLRQPMRRNERGEWTPIGWAEALDLAARRLVEIRNRHGRSSVATYFGNPLVHNTGGILFGILFARALKTRSAFSATSLDQLPQMLAAWAMFGHQLMLPVPDIDRAQLFVAIGANPLVSNGSLMSAPGFRRRINDLKDRGGQVWVIDPRRTETASVAHRHVFVHPGTDALLLAAVARTVFEELGPRLGTLKPHVQRLEAAREAVAPFSPENTAARTGVDPETCRALAHALHRTDGAVLYGRIGVCTQAFGGLAAWLVNLVNLICGNLDVEGGAMFPSPAVDPLEVAARVGRTGSFARRRSRVRGLPEFGGELPTAVLAEEIETEGEDRIRALVTAAGNPVLSAPNGARLDRALGKLDFMVSIDPYLNETTRHADLILPPVSPLEREHYDLVFHGLAVRNTAKYVPPVLKRPRGGLDDGEIFVELAGRLRAAHGQPIRGWLERRVLRWLGVRGVVRLMLRRGKSGLRLADLDAAPSGRDLGPLVPRLPERLFTADQRIDAAPACILADLPRLEAERDAERPALVLIGRRELRSNNSWMHNLEGLRRGRRRCTLRVHPADAEGLGLEDGGQARLSSSVGSLSVEVEVSDEMMPGVVSLPHGYGHGRKGTRTRVADSDPGVSLNDVMDDARVDALTGNAAFSGTSVRLQPQAALEEPSRTSSTASSRSDHSKGLSSRG